MQPEQDPDPQWVMALSGRSEPAVLRKLDEAGRERQLYAHLSRMHTAEGRESYIEIDAPLELHALVRLLRPRHVVEVGVSSGVSSAYLLYALEQNQRGMLHSIDLPSFPRKGSRGGDRARASWSLPPGRASGWAVPSTLRKRWDLRLGDKSDVLPQLADQLPTIDLLLYDVPHNERDIRAELRVLDPLLGSGAVVIIDHGPGGEACAALRSWARAVGAPVRGRRGLGLYGARRPSA